MSEYVEILGTDGQIHYVEAEFAERHFSGKDGSLVTDAEWDEQQRRIQAAINAPPGPHDEGYVP